jgi:pyruvate dehydrogenase E2 component (dihydrolipoamide acetyltransferase)
MAKEITMPKLSDTMEEGKVLRWLKQVGDRVERGEVIAEVETDKADMEMEAFDSGVLLAIQVKAGESAAVGEVIGYVGKEGERLEQGRARGVEAEMEASTDVEAAPAATGKGRVAAGSTVPSERKAVAVGSGSRGGGEGSRGSGQVPRGSREGPGGSSKGAQRGAGGARDRDNAEVPGPHADIAEEIEPEGTEEEEGEEGSARQAPAHGRGAAGEARRRAAGAKPGSPAPTKGMNDRLPAPEEPEERFPRLKISPVARRLAAEAGLDPAGLRGSGPDGRIVKEDVEGALRSRAAAGRGAGAAPSAGRAPDRPAPSPTVPVASGELGASVPHSNLRRAIAARMADAKRTAPHFYTTVAVRMDEALKLKDALLLRDPESRVGVSHLIVKAAALALQRHPRINGVFEEEQIRIPAEINIGLAVAVEDGLLVPVIRDCAGKSLHEIAREARELVARVRRGKLRQDDLRGATFSVSNMGMFEIEQFAAILTPPQSAILAVGGTAAEAVVQDGRVVPGKVMRLTLSADHRAIDGVLAAAFLVELKRFLENPLSLIV